MQERLFYKTIKLWRVLRIYCSIVMTNIALMVYMHFLSEENKKTLRYVTLGRNWRHFTLTKFRKHTAVFRICNVDVYYTRRHSTLTCLSPYNFRHQWCYLVQHVPTLWSWRHHRKSPISTLLQLVCLFRQPRIRLNDIIIMFEILAKLLYAFSLPYIIFVIP